MYICICIYLAIIQQAFTFILNEMQCNSKYDWIFTEQPTSSLLSIFKELVSIVPFALENITRTHTNKRKPEVSRKLLKLLLTYM